MQLGALTSYLQNQPTGSTQTPQAVDATAAVEELKPEDYRLSTKALMVSAIASEFDVEAIPRQQLGQFQQRLQQYGLLHGSGLSAMAVISAAPDSDNAASEVNALERVGQALDQFEHNQTPYSARQRITHLHTLLQNMKSAR